MRALIVLILVMGCGGSWVGGIHARLGWSETRGLRVVDVPPGTAERAGLRPNDRVVEIDGVPVEQLSQEEVVEHLRGPVGSRVILRIERDGESMPIEIERAPYE